MGQKHYSHSAAGIALSPGHSQLFNVTLKNWEQHEDGATASTPQHSALIVLNLCASTENSDYVSVDSQGLTFSSGQSSSSMSTQCGELIVLNDAALEVNETFSVSLTSASPVIITAGRSEAEVIIQEDANDCK